MSHGHCTVGENNTMKPVKVSGDQFKIPATNSKCVKLIMLFSVKKKQSQLNVNLLTFV